MTVKRQPIVCNLVKNSIAAYYAAIEIHNKPFIEYRYQTVVVLLINAWELLLKAYVKKYLKKSIFEKNGNTLHFDTVLQLVANDINGNKHNSFEVTKNNIKLLDKYRDNIVHFYVKDIDCVIFSLVSKSCMLFDNFLHLYFSRYANKKNDLYILPIGFKLPFDLVGFLSNKTCSQKLNEHITSFLRTIVSVSKSLNEIGINESVVLGFDVALNGVKSPQNADIIARVDKNASTMIGINKKVRITNDPDAQPVQIAEEEWRGKYPLTYSEVCEMCKKSIPAFKQVKKFNKIMEEVKKKPELVFVNKLNRKNPKSASQKFYSMNVIDYIKKGGIKVK